MIEANRGETSVTIKKLKFNNDKEILLGSNDIIIFVGPNNVGKSRVLKDIKDDLIDPKRNKTIIKEIDYNTNNFNNICIENFFEQNIFKSQNENYEVFLGQEEKYTYNKYNFEKFDSLKREFYKAFFIFLSTENRLGITKPISFNYIQDFFSLNIMEELQTNLEEIKKLNDILIFGFDKAIDVIDTYKNSYMCKMYKLGNEEQINFTINANSRESKKKLNELEDLHEQGDGIRSAIAILASLIVGKKSIYLIDEPEVFLHPPQARLLGNKIVELSENKQCFISTHNIDLIRGILEKDSSRVKVIKIERVDNTNMFYELGIKQITAISNDKNLKYTNILNGLFYDRVVLCENESDCKFYSAILENMDSNIYQKTLFCAVGGKDQFKLVIPLLKSLEIKYLVIADIDLINNADKLKQLLNSIDTDRYDAIKEIHKEFLNEYEEKTNSLVKKQIDIKAEINSLFTEDKYITDETVKKIKEALKAINNFKLLKSAGKSSIPPGKCVLKFNKIETYLNENNIYFLDCGEIEKLVPTIDSHGSKWVENVFSTYKDMDDKVYDKAKEFIKKVFKIN